MHLLVFLFAFFKGLFDSFLKGLFVCLFSYFDFKMQLQFFNIVRWTIFMYFACYLLITLYPDRRFMYSQKPITHVTSSCLLRITNECAVYYSSSRCFLLQITNDWVVCYKIPKPRSFVLKITNNCYLCLSYIS